MLSKKSIALKPTALGYTLIGKAKQDLGDTDSALEEYEKALLLNPDIELALKFKAEAKSINDITEAKEHIKVYDKLIKLNPQQSEFFLNRAVTKHLSGDINGALTDLKKGINLYNENLAYCNSLNNNLVQKHQRSLQFKRFESPEALRVRNQLEKKVVPHCLSCKKNFC